MVKQETINFDDARSCIVKELTVKHLKRAATFLSENAEAMETENPVEFIKGKWDELYGLFGDRFQFTGGALDDLSFSEVDQLIDTFLQLHKGIGGKLGKLMSLKNQGQAALATKQNAGNGSART